MLRGLWQLTWIEIKIFLREPMGAFGTIVSPVLLFVVLGRTLGGRVAQSALIVSRFIRVGLPVLTAVLIALGSV
jgi:ABC-2 type transport system permease protein